ncbi:hypothetical protein MUO65_02225 [bacterium]|nr:hypothetical protein [bacterium]
MAEVPSVNKLYETILSRSTLPLPGIEDALIEEAWQRANRIHDYLLERADRMDEDCMLCEKKKARQSQTRYAYDTPWDNEPVAKLFCSDDCGDSFMYEEPWAYFMCGKCDREISEQNPRNGWHIKYRDYDGQMTCLKCYEDLILENGVERDKVEAGKIPGMFFSYGNLEPIKAGYREVEGFRDFFVSCQWDADRFRKKALELMDQGRKVVIGYERMAIGGGEGYVTLMEKEPEKPRKRRKHAAQNHVLDSSRNGRR